MSDVQNGWHVLGVDPGVSGAAALLWIAGRGAAAPPPVLERLVQLDDLARIGAMALRADIVVVEAQRASPQMGTTSAFTLGRACGRVQGALEGVGAAGVVEVWPNVWRGAYGLAGGKAGKVRGLMLAGELLRDAAAVSRHDEADAVLLAWWGWRHVIVPKLAAHAIDDARW